MLTHKQIEFLQVFAAAPFMPLAEICKQIRVTKSQVASWRAKHQPFREAMEGEYLRSQRVLNMSRKGVMRGLMDAIDMAAEMRQPSAMISGWKEVGRMCGFYEPERREIALSVNAQEMLAQIKTIPREQLLQLAHEQDVLDGSE